MTYTRSVSHSSLLYMLMQLPEGSKVEEDDEVSFEGRLNVATGARKATAVQLCSKATEQPSKRELGQVGLAAHSPVPCRPHTATSTATVLLEDTRHRMQMCTSFYVIPYFERKQKDCEGFDPADLQGLCSISVCTYPICSLLLLPVTLGSLATDWTPCWDVLSLITRPCWGVIPVQQICSALLGPAVMSS